MLSLQLKYFYDQYQKCAKFEPPMTLLKKHANFELSTTSS